jgi:hypothetical protein
MHGVAAPGNAKRTASGATSNDGFLMVSFRTRRSEIGHRRHLMAYIYGMCVYLELQRRCDHVNSRWGQ